MKTPHYTVGHDAAFDGEPWSVTDTDTGRVVARFAVATHARDWSELLARDRDDTLDVAPCRFARAAAAAPDVVAHVCQNRDGHTPPRRGTECWAEARAQLLEQGVALDLAAS